MKEKKRLDTLVYELGFAQSREKAKALIMSGNVYVDNQKSDKPGTSYNDNVKIEVRGKTMPYVSRGGLKLNKAIESFDISLKDKVCMDIGASTGGFTDCMLHHGAKKVYAIDVGYGQLDWKLRTDNRVVNLERTNVRYITEKEIPEKIDFFSVDVSFISLCLVLPVARKFMKSNSKAVCLIKPQFEAGREKVGKKGVVRDFKVHIEVINKIEEFVLNNGFNILGFDYSPVKGPEGNIEYLVYLEKSENMAGKVYEDIDNNIDELVRNSHYNLNGGM